MAIRQLRTVMCNVRQLTSVISNRLQSVQNEKVWHLRACKTIKYRQFIISSVDTKVILNYNQQSCMFTYTRRLTILFQDAYRLKTWSKCVGVDLHEIDFLCMAHFNQKFVQEYSDAGSKNIRKLCLCSSNRPKFPSNLSFQPSISNIPIRYTYPHIQKKYASVLIQKIK